MISSCDCIIIHCSSVELRLAHVLLIVFLLKKKFVATSLPDKNSIGIIYRTSQVVNIQNNYLGIEIYLLIFEKRW